MPSRSIAHRQFAPRRYRMTAGYRLFLGLPFNLWAIVYLYLTSDNLPYEKVGKNEPVCIADEVPFDIPDSWEWTRLGFVSSYAETKKKIKAQDAPPDLWQLDLEDIEKGGRILEHKTVGERKAVGDKTFFEAGNVLYSKLRPYLLKVLVAPADGICTPEIVPFSLYGNILPEYIVAFLKSPYVDGVINAVTYGVKMPRVGTQTMTALLLPLPPLNEQQRIVNKINEVMPIVAKYDTTYSEVKELNETFPEALKRSILQWAVQGKLVPQDPADEPAEALLERIRAEKQKLIKEGKIKKDKHESVIFRRDNSHYEKLDGVERCIDDELPFEIPENWNWCRLKSIVNVVSARRVHQSDWRSEGVPFYRAREIGKLADTGSVDNELFITEALYTEFSSSGVPHPGDLMVTAVGTLGKTYIVKDSDRFYYKDASVICFENFGKINPAYLKLLMYSPYMEEQIKQNSAGTTVDTITIVKANEYLIPLPPLMEQQRIVDQAECLQIHIEKL